MKFSLNKAQKNSKTPAITQLTIELKHITNQSIAQRHCLISLIAIHMSHALTRLADGFGLLTVLRTCAIHPLGFMPTWFPRFPFGKLSNLILTYLLIIIS